MRVVVLPRDPTFLCRRGQPWLSVGSHDGESTATTQGAFRKVVRCDQEREAIAAAPTETCAHRHGP